jgi:hypothetical protein
MGEHRRRHRSYADEPDDKQTAHTAEDFQTRSSFEQTQQRRGGPQRGPVTVRLWDAPSRVVRAPAAGRAIVAQAECSLQARPAVTMLLWTTQSGSIIRRRIRTQGALTALMSWMKYLAAALGGAALALGAASLPSIGLALLVAAVLLLAVSLRSAALVAVALIAAAAVWLVIALANNETSCLPGGETCSAPDAGAWFALSAAALGAGIVASGWSLRHRRAATYR